MRKLLKLFLFKICTFQMMHIFIKWSRSPGNRIGWFHFFKMNIHNWYLKKTYIWHYLQCIQLKHCSTYLEVFPNAKVFPPYEFVIKIMVYSLIWLYKLIFPKLGSSSLPILSISASYVIFVKLKLEMQKCNFHY